MVRLRSCLAPAAFLLVFLVPHAAANRDLPVPVGVDSLLAEPMPPDAPVQVTPLGRTEEVSVQLVRVRTEVRAHHHAGHAETIHILQGGGKFTIGENVFEAGPGDVFVVPSGVVHAFVTTSDGPAAALTTFSPAFDGKDRIYEDEGGEN